MLNVARLDRPSPQRSGRGVESRRNKTGRCLAAICVNQARSNRTPTLVLNDTKPRTST